MSQMTTSAIIIIEYKMRLVHKKILFALFLIIVFGVLGLIFADSGGGKDDALKNIAMNAEDTAIEAPAEEIPTKGEAPASEDCVSDTRVEEDIVNGSSLSGLIENGEKILVYYGYYDCREVERRDTVIYGYAGKKESLIKIVHGIPGDRFELKKNGIGWNIIVNGEILKNSEGLDYNVSDSAYKMLHLYESDYQGIIPGNAYLLLGNLISGTLDSTHFGLVGKSDILGKAVPVEK